MNETEHFIRQILQAAKSPVVAWSGGRDSTVLLHMAREIMSDIAIVWFKQNVSHEWERWCESIITAWDLTVFTYPASDTYYLPNSEGLTLIDEYSFGSARMPVLTDISGGAQCGAKISRGALPSFPYPWDVTLTGYRQSDHHSVLGYNFFPENGMQCGNTRLVTPLREWTNDDVARAYQRLGLSVPPDDCLPRCTNCLTGTGKVWCPEANAFIDSIKWEPTERLNEFRSRFVPDYKVEIDQGRGLSPQ